MDLRPQTRGERTDTDTAIADLIRRFPAETIVGCWAREQRDERALEALDWKVCQDASRCTSEAVWRGDATCPDCGNGLFATGTTIYLCTHHYRASVEALRWAGRVGWTFNHNTAEQVMAAITWAEL